jgi:plasmid stabilization system protein ParE
VAADALIDKLVEKSVLLAANAELGRAPAGNPRRLAQLSGRQLHLVLSPRARGIELTRVLHGARDIDALLF